MKKKIFGALALMTMSSLVLFTACGQPNGTSNVDLGEKANNENVNDYVVLSEYKGVEYTPMSVEVSDEEVDKQIETLLTSFSETVEVTDRAVEDGDTVNADYVGSIDGVEFAGGNTQGQGSDIVIGSGRLIDDFEEQLIGANIGDTVDVLVTFPETYGDEELNGKEALFVVTINSISDQVIPELNDEFAVENLEVDTIAEYKANIRESLEGFKKDEAKHSNQNAVLANVVDNSTYPKLPQGDVDEVKKTITAQYEAQAAAQQVDLEAYLFLTFQMSLEEFDAQISEVAEYNVKQNIVLRAISVAEKITISEDEYKAGVARFTEDFQMESEEALLELYKEDQVREALVFEKTLEFITDNGKAV